MDRSDLYASIVSSAAVVSAATLSKLSLNTDNAAETAAAVFRAAIAAAKESGP
jgi:hypothetical protein